MTLSYSTYLLHDFSSYSLTLFVVADTLYGVLFVVFIILLVVTSFITIALTYFQLAVEDHRWWWRSLFSGGSTGVFVYIYCFFYYFHRSEMYGFLQASFFFGYMAVACYAFT